MDPADTLGGKCNRLLYVAKGDYAVIMGERCICTSFKWDKPIVETMVTDTRVRWWSGMSEGSYECPVFSRRWIDACNKLFGGVFPDLFPFWFIDTWTRDVDILVSCDNPVHIASSFANPRREPSIGARDIPFWSRFFAELHSEREEWAMRLRNEFELDPPPELSESISQSLEADAFERMKLSETWEARFGDKSEPDARYIAAKIKAEKVLNGEADDQA
jgi:hypothetical protein